MPDSLATSAPTSAAPAHEAGQAYEDEIFAETEALMNTPVAGTANHAEPPRRRRLAPLLLLSGVGVALALVPFGVKDVLTTGRSVAHDADR